MNKHAHPATCAARLLGALAVLASAMILGWAAGATAQTLQPPTNLRILLEEAYVPANGTDLATWAKNNPTQPAAARINKQITLTGPLTLPANLVLQFDAGGQINRANYALTLNCAVQAPDTAQIFAGTGAIAGKLLADHLTPQWFGARGDGATDDTTALQTALNLVSGNSRMVIPKTAAKYITGPLFAKSNSTIDFENGATLYARPGYKTGDPGEQVLSFEDVENVTVNGNGGIIQMPKAEYTTGEWRHCLDVSGSKNIKIYNLSGLTSGGDGIIITYSYKDFHKPSQDILVSGCTFDGNRRQGMSIITAINVMVTNCVFSNTSGTLPECGVDIEPAQSFNVLQNIVIDNCVAFGNNNVGFLVWMDLLGASSPVSITIQNCRSYNNKSLAYRVHGGTTQQQGSVKLVNNKSS